ncbi:MAG: dephospho-CoA kinase [Epsilonproteobacteria bacterium]|nr:dephospho-CoA kinase [Campylobacterota bacterium]
MAFQYAIVLTGGIATGKSTVSNILIQLGFYIIDADKVAHEVLEEQKRVEKLERKDETSVYLIINIQIKLYF